MPRQRHSLLDLMIIFLTSKQFGSATGSARERVVGILWTIAHATEADVSFDICQPVIVADLRTRMTAKWHR